MCKTKKSIYLRFSSLEMTHTDQKIMQTFLPCLRNDECFLFHVITRRNYFLYKFIVTQRLGTAAIVLCSLKQAF